MQQMSEQIHWNHGTPTKAQVGRTQGLHNQPGCEQVHGGPLQPARPQPGKLNSHHFRTNQN